MEQSVSFSLHMKHIYTLLDNVIKLYTLGAHKHLAKLCAIREHLEEFTESYRELKERYKTGSIDEEVAEETFSVLESKIMSYSRQLILINSNELNESKKANIFWLMKLLLNTLEHASSCGHLFSFIPDYFLETLISLCSAIRFSFNVSSDGTTKQEYESLIKQFASFIASHFNDERVTIAELKDNLSQALASFVSNPETLSALESISVDKRMQMVRSLCQPYENRAWAQSNWTMVCIITSLIQ
jgi:Kip1 ubiquitination-promoting complex protein 1